LYRAYKENFFGGIIMARAPAPAPTSASKPQGRVALESDYARRQLEDALALARYAVSTGVESQTAEVFPVTDIGLIQATAAQLGMFEPSNGKAQPASNISADDWIAFEQAYYRLAIATSPVTAETLAATRATTQDPDEQPSFINRLLGYSPALRFTSWFALGALCIAIFVIAAECLVYVWGQESDTNKYLWQRNLMQSLLPWTYGALGSCAYLLRSAHYYIYQRSFDLRRKPEYFNRVLLGAISGGAIILFVDYLVDDDSGNVLHLSSAALGFVAGYSTDFLFNTVERVVAAIFPKIDSDPKAQLSRPRKPVLPKGRTFGGPPHHASDGGAPEIAAAAVHDAGDDQAVRPPRRRRTAAGKTGTEEN
jgi:hypothetical protein